MTNAPLLPLQPIPPDKKQEALTRDILRSLEPLSAFLLELRQAADEELAPLYPDFEGKPYPLGRCREIRDAVYDRLGAEIQTPSTEIGHALNLFIRTGGIGRKIWGVLRESYFQNAIQIGTYYVDVANDTVVASKPKIEILPLNRSGMIAVRDMFHFARTAKSYWECETFANTALPGLAAFFPIAVVSRRGGISLAPASDQMIALTRGRRFQPAIEFLERMPAAPDAIAKSMQRLADKISREQKDEIFPGADRLRIRGDALTCVRKEQKEGLYDSQAFYDATVAALKAVNNAQSLQRAV